MKDSFSKNNILFIIIFLPVCIGNVFAQEENSACKDLLYNYIEQFAEMELPERKNAYYLKIKLENNPREKSQKSRYPSDLVEIINTKNQLVYNTNNFSIYQDQEDLFYVYHFQKIIQWSNSTRNNEEIMQKSWDLSKLQKKLIDISEISECKDDTINSNIYKHIRINLPQSYVSDIANCEYYYNTNKNLLEKVIVYYSDSHILDNKVVEFLEVNFDYKPISLKKAKSEIFDRKGKLLPKYSSYKLVNNKK